jgi:hypothetical protein
MKLLLRTSLLVLTALFLAACGGGSGDGPSLSPVNSSTPTETPDTGGTSVTVVPSFGSFNTAGTFTVATIAKNKTSLTAGQSASLAVSFVGQDNKLITDAADVLFTSTCSIDDLSDFDQDIVSNTTGTIRATYTARGCSGTDTITAQSTLNGTNYRATTTIDTIPAALGSITFVSADPKLIGIRGTGALPEQSTVSFQVKNEAGGPVENLDVNFSLNTTAGDIGLTNTTATTNSEGIVSTTVISGTVATTVRITASAIRDGKTISAQSSLLLNTTGIIDQNSFTLGASTLNIEGLDYNGVETTLTILAADRFNNPVPDDTAIAFTTEGGIIDSGCTTVNGTCSVIFRSANPRANGRATILATAIGEESFEDTTPSNGSYDDGEIFDDYPEAFIDYNEDGCRDANEPYLDFNNDGNYTGTTQDLNNDGKCRRSTPDEIIGNSTYDGLRCISSAQNCEITASTISVREEIVIVMSGSSLYVTVTPATINIDAGASVLVTVRDVNFQVPPAGTTISVTTDQGSISGESSATVLSTNVDGAIAYSFALKPSSSKIGTGTFTVTVETPKGVISKGTATVVQTALAP